MNPMQNVTTSPRVAPKIPFPKACCPSLGRLPVVGPGSATGDQVQFSGNSQLPRVVGANWDVDETHKHYDHLKSARQQAQKAKEGAFGVSHRHYGAKVVLSNGVQAVSTNIEATRETTLCDLRGAVVTALNQALAQDEEQVAPDLKVETVYLTNAALDGEAPVPCADCQEWLNSDWCTPDTQVISLESDPQSTGEALIRVRTVGQMLPFHRARRDSATRLTTDKPLETLAVETSQEAIDALGRSGEISYEQALLLMKRAQRAYTANESARDSQKRTGAAVLVSPLKLMIGGGRFDWTTRWFEAADLKTAALAVQLVQALQGILRKIIPSGLEKRLAGLLAEPRIQAVAYYGDDANLPPVASLGRIGRRRGSADTLVLTVENEIIQIRTLSQFMPELYQTPPKD